MPDVMAPESVEPGPFTWADFTALDEDDLRELIDGELVEVEVPTKAHERIFALVVYFLESWAQAGDGGMTLGAGYKIRITEKRGVMPDAQFYRKGTSLAARRRATSRRDALDPPCRSLPTHAEYRVDRRRAQG